MVAVLLERTWLALRFKEIFIRPIFRDNNTHAGKVHMTVDSRLSTGTRP
jgi:hypothetical protein